MAAQLHPVAVNPYANPGDAIYLEWRSRKLARAPKNLAELVVEIRDPFALQTDERAALIDACRRANMAIYKTRAADDPDKAIPQAIARQLGLDQPDRNLLADEDGLTSLSVANAGMRSDYIPYTNRRLNWHTDGYYNRPEETIRAFHLHCVRPAMKGGENALLDPELAYIALCDESPAFINAFNAPDAMTIPAREDDDGIARAAQPGPVFSINNDGSLHMRYTARKRSIEWKQTPETLAAVAVLERLLASPSANIFHARLDSGMGLICNNVLHDRTAFEDDPQRPRLIYRARYYQRVAQS